MPRDTALDPGNVSSFTVELQTRTRISVLVVDGSPIRRAAPAEPIWVELCGDSVCGEGEDVAGCVLDCGAGAATRDAGAAPSMPVEDAGAENPAETPSDAGIEFSSCSAACAYRNETLGCPDPIAACTPICTAVFDTAALEGVCASAATALEACRYSTRAFDLGCNAASSVVDAQVCAARAATLQACRITRDAPNPGGGGGASVVGDTPAEYCPSACAYRSNALGCAGDPGTCAAVCLAAHAGLATEGVCTELALERERCYWSQPALDLGCTATSAELDEAACALPAAALGECRQQRD
jgi:hypothetical protein